MSSSPVTGWPMPVAIPSAGRGGWWAGLRRLLGDRVIWTGAVVGAAVVTGVLAVASPIVLMGILGISCGAYAFLRYPWLVLSSILLVRAAIDASGTQMGLGGTNAIGAMNAGIAFGGGAALFLSRRRLPARGVTYAFIAFLAIAFLSIRSSPMPQNGFNTWLPLAALLVLFCWAALIVRNKADLRRLAWLTVLSSPIPMLMAYFQLATGTGFIDKGDGYFVVSGTMAEPNGFAFYCLVILTFCIVLLNQPLRFSRRVLVVGLMGMAAGCLLFTYTRSAWIGLLGVLLIMGFLHFRAVLVALTLAGAVTLLAAPVLIGTVEDRFSDVSGSSQSDTNSWAWRSHNWSAMFDYTKDQPLRGHGLGSYRYLTWERFGSFERNFAIINTPEEGIVAHNDYLNMAVELGYPGLALWVWVLLGLTLLAWRARRLAAARPYAVGCFALMIAFLIISAVDNVQSYVVVTLYPIVLIGAVWGLRTRVREARAGR